ncbi:CheY chemotaxis protein or a CheY-like REC (receiver) domain [Arenibacter nanhaiticus]|uniref:CheY chemotaxis protein or a CheY-like REC (Receiver) domain n=1 Tax=Arenibacter nanhaiticus TaxID=558155 RepID=A0A1M6N6N2_9FLAO|nr:response regulator [Arenibacter nanhaiticus]SHJ91357.1 CheY chemotaxis protein or a CheY-like REC (receiver) domain [Arenibacter nanhaiticus]
MIDQLQSKFERVMIIDDNPTDLYISPRIILKNNFGKKVFEYSSGEEALKFLQQNQENTSLLPEVIFVDIYMPLMSGFEFLEEYNKLSTTLKKQCQVFIMSSTIDDLDIVRARTDQNVSFFQVKPITIEFLNRINTY